jgi:hypothetical protein
MIKVTRKRLAAYVMMVSVVILGIQAGSQILFFAYKGYFRFQQEPPEKFNVREFTVLIAVLRAVLISHGFSARWPSPQASPTPPAAPRERTPPRPQSAR